LDRLTSVAARGKARRVKIALGLATALGLVAACGGSASTGLFTGPDAGPSGSSGVSSGSGSGSSGVSSSSASGSGGASSSASSSTGGGTSSSSGASTSSSGGSSGDAAPPPEAGAEGGLPGQLCDVFNADPFKLVQWKLAAQQSVQDGTAVYCGKVDACTAAQCCFPLATDLEVCVTK
jgi:hypothetical protein